MDYFIAPVIESESEINFGCVKGYGYKSNIVLKTLKKSSMGSGVLVYNGDEFVEVYRNKKIDKLHIANKG